MKRIRYSICALALSIGLPLIAPGTAHATNCDEFIQSTSSQSPSSFTILDTDIGTEAYQRLLPYSNGGHRALGMAIAAKFNYFDNCEYIGIGIGDGSGGNGYRPNYTIWMWRDGVDVDIARTAIYELVGASPNPVVTNGDCNISCDGTFGRQFDGSFETTTSTTTTSLPQVADSNSDDSQSQVEVISTNESSTSPTATTTSTTIAVVANAALAQGIGAVANQSNQVSFKNCLEVNAIYPWGIAKTLTAAKKQKNYPINNPFVSKSLYQKLAKMDRDKDLTVCEK